MPVQFPDYVDALAQGFSAHQNKYFGGSQNIGKIMDKLFNRLSILLFRIEKQINELVLKGGYPPKKLNQWGMEARSLKYQENDIRERLNNIVDLLQHEEMVKIVIKIVNHLKKCPFKDEMMYDKPVPVITLTPKSYFGKQSTNTDQENEAEVPEYQKAEHSSNPVPSQEMLIEEDAPKIEIEHIESDGVMSTVVEIEREPISNSVAQSMQPPFNHSVPEQRKYTFHLKEGNLELGLDHQQILIRDVPSLGPPESARVDGVITLVETDLRELSQEPNHPNSVFLFLQRNKCLSHIDPSFFNSIPDLRFLDLSDTKIRTLPSSLFILSKLEVLLLRNCICLDTLPSEIGKLIQLQVLDLLGTELYSLPNAIEKLTRLRCLQLSFYGPDDESEYSHLPHELISDAVLSKLEALESLCIIVHPEDHRWKKVAACVVENVNSMKKLSFIQFYFPDMKIFKDFIQMRPSWKEQRPWKLFKTGTSWEERELRKFKFIVGNNVKRIVSRVSGEVESLFDQQDMSLRYVNVDKVPKVIKTVLTRVTAFYLDHHITIQSLSEFGISNFKELKFCVVTECPNIQVILDSKTTKVAFPSLEHLAIFYLWKLERINKMPTPIGDFRALKYLTVNTCPKLEFIFWESMLPSFSNLEELSIEDCESVAKIVSNMKKKADNGAMVVLPRLRKLVLHYLPKLISCEVLNFLRGRLQEDKISIKGCPKLSSVEEKRMEE